MDHDRFPSSRLPRQRGGVTPRGLHPTGHDHVPAADADPLPRLVEALRIAAEVRGGRGR